MSNKTTFIISSHLMFQHGLKSLLSQQNGVDIIGHSTNPDSALEQIKTLQPDVVIVDNTKLPVDLISKLLKTLNHQRDMKVIGLNLHDNQLTLYQRSQPAAVEYQKLEWRVDGITDLLNAISYNSIPS
jgi:DNA-binding NarL/FixJ family response regulator